MTHCVCNGLWNYSKFLDHVTGPYVDSERYITIIVICYIIYYCISFFFKLTKLKYAIAQYVRSVINNYTTVIV